MCGIIGYVGRRQAQPIILEGLRRLEYRGYDSAGLAVLYNGEIALRKKTGKIDEGLARLLKAHPAHGQVGVGHTRWATHGEPSDANSHPHCDQSERIAVVHNGVIENYERLRARLKGHTFRSATDTEVLAHLIGEHYDQVSKRGPTNSTHPLAQAVMDALREVIGAYGIAVICRDHPDLMIGARRGSPLILGIGQDENFLASDVTAVVPHTRQVIYLNDYDVVTLRGSTFEVSN